MANEISITLTLQGTKNGITFEQSVNLLRDMAGDEMCQNVQIVGTSAETLHFGDAASPGYVFLKNLDATHYIDLYAVSGETPFARLAAGDITLIKSGEQSMLAKANTAACKLLVFVIEG